MWFYLISKKKKNEISYIFLIDRKLHLDAPLRNSHWNIVGNKNKLCVHFIVLNVFCNTIKNYWVRILLLIILLNAASLNITEGSSKTSQFIYKLKLYWSDNNMYIIFLISIFIFLLEYTVVEILFIMSTVWVHRLSSCSIWFHRRRSNLINGFDENSIISLLEYILKYLTPS